MADIYIKNKHGIVHSIPEEMIPQVKKQGCVPLTEEEVEALTPDQEIVPEASNPDEPKEPEKEPDPKKKPAPKAAKSKAEADAKPAE